MSNYVLLVVFHYLTQALFIGSGVSTPLVLCFAQNANVSVAMMLTSATNWTVWRRELALIAHVVVNADLFHH